VKGYVEEVRTDRVRGWAFDSRQPDVSPKIRILLSNAVVAEGVASSERPDVAKVMGVSSAQCGFRMKVNLAADLLDKVTVQASTDEKWVDVTKLKPRRRSYQDFDGSGASRSHEKLKALHLESLTVGKAGAGEPLAGKSVLDIGCNEGFFCAEALRQGATRVLGVDANKEFVERARSRVKGAEFLHASWWDLPEEKFDVIFFLSAIHYEPEPKKLLDKLTDHLTDDGVLVLECGVKGGPGKKQWHVVPRWDGAKRYPSLDLLRQELLSKYGVRSIGSSVSQAGDLVPRFVFHCNLRRPVAMVITGAPHAGKTALAHELLDHGIPNYDSDSALARLLTHDELRNLPLAQKLREQFGKDSLRHLGLVSGHIVSANLCNEFVSFVVKELPVEAELFMIEGEAFRHKEVQKALSAQLSKAGIRAWLVERAN
jgi:protein-L-isoaspartate O-methyltransferase